MQRLNVALKWVSLAMAGTLLAGCSYFLDHDIELTGCFPALEYSTSEADKPIYNLPFYDTNNPLIAAGYNFNVVNYYFSSSSIAESGELVFDDPAPMSGRFSMNGDMVISVPGWAHKYLGGSTIALYFPITYQGEHGVFNAYTMGDSGLALPQGISASCKQEIVNVCEGRHCRFLKYLSLEE
ncbi:hypothetical protein PRUB_a2001 [Pseudoalteromonas rubra]|uniref:Lipoprotein n=1 Tax=Pseudoalteromonas rubra TaxID=43658 RepID=A0A8T0CEE7_9GAMM|nr:hypothetical protein [Pseudoalteromonas rubra]KAF7788900.1 hypothetical protein PRUB_a2001 [Pseudoalteromonas rubra]